MATISVSNPNYVVAQSDRSGGYIPHVFKSKSQFMAWMAETHCRDILPAHMAHGRCKPAIDHRREDYIEVDQDEHEQWLAHLEQEYNFRQEALAMTPITNTKTVTVAQQEAQEHLKDAADAQFSRAMDAVAQRSHPERSAAEPKGAAPVTSPALLEVQALRGEVKDLAAFVESKVAELDTIVSAIAKTIADQPAALNALVSGIMDKLVVHDAKLNAIAISIAASQAQQPTPAPSTPAQSQPSTSSSPMTVTMNASTIALRTTKSGDPVIHVFGGQYSVYGVPLYPEFYAACDLQADADSVSYHGRPIGPKPIPYGPRVLVEMRTNGNGAPKPYRVVGLAA